MSNESWARGLVQVFFGMPRFAPAWFAALLALLLLVFVARVPEKVQTYMIPSLVAYALGAALLGSIHRMLGAHYFQKGDPNNEQRIHPCWKVALLFFHLLWFALWLVYNFVQDVL